MICAPMLKQLSFTVLGLPTSVNHMYGQNGPIRYKTPAAKLWAKKIAEAAQFAQLADKPHFDGEQGFFETHLRLFWADHRKRDARNMEKIIHDALEDIIYSDDKQVKRTIIEEWFGEPRLEMTIREMDLEEPQIQSILKRIK